MIKLYLMCFLILLVDRVEVEGLGDNVCHPELVSGSL